MAEIMFDQDGTRIVLLNRKFDHNGRDQQELRLRCTKDGAMLFHFFQSSEPKNYALSTAEADAFCEQWMAYRAEQKAAEQTERERQQALIAEAYRLAGQHVKIETDSTASPTWWRVSCPASGWESAYAAQSPETLLSDVKSANEHYQLKLPYIKHMHRNTKVTA
jgi:hypothetical protein